MGIFDFFSPKTTTSPPTLPRRDAVDDNFATAEWVIKEAFDSVMVSVDVASEIKGRFFRDYSRAHRDGDPRKEGNAAIDALANSTWSWADFEKWDKHFRDAGTWPYMWLSLHLNEDHSARPSTIDSALGYMTVKDLMAFAAHNGLRSKPMPKNRAEFEKIIKDGCSLSTVLAAVAPEVEKRFADFNQRKEVAKCRLLAHTLTMKTYSLRDKIHFDDLKGGIVGYKRKIIGNTGCPIEDMYAEKFNRTEIKDLPPFFPGDRNSIDFVHK